MIRIPRDLYESLPQIYQVIAQIGEQSGQVAIVEEQPESKQKKTRPKDTISAATSETLVSDSVWIPID
jgi:hypothetical protein